MPSRIEVRSGTVPLIDPELSEGALLAAHHTPPEVFVPLANHFTRSPGVRDRVIICRDDDRDQYLLELRHRVDQQVHHDLSYTLQRLWQWCVDHGPPAWLEDYQVHHLLIEMNRTRQLLMETSAWSRNQAELDCWIALHQFYCDALALAHRLIRLEQGAAVSHQVRRRYKVAPGSDAFGLLQVAFNMAQHSVPNFLHFKPASSMLPILLYQGLCAAAPCLTFKWASFLRYFRAAYTCGALGSYGSHTGDVVDMRNKWSLLGNDFFFEPRTRRSRHNIILALSHRHSVLDCPLMAVALSGLDTAIWANELYLPRSAARDPRIVLVSPAKKKPLAQTLARSAHVMIDKGLPMVIFVDGGGPYMMYGQQMRVKRGIRVLVDYLDRVTKGGGRKTFIVPVSFDDTLALIRGQQTRVRITFHQAICSDDIARPPEARDHSVINYGDPLLNHLECQFLLHTAQLRHGFATPRVIETARRFDEHIRRDRSLRGRLRGRFGASIYELARESAATGRNPSPSNGSTGPRNPVHAHK